MAISFTESNPFPVHKLSTREREVLDLAVQGKTDEEIARELGTAVSTINSYWVRIRGKLGQLSRTELVGAVLRHESNLRYADLIAENERLKESGLEMQRDLAESERNLRNERGGGWHLHALDHVSDATLVCRPPGDIVYANLHAEHLFAAEPGELESLKVWELAIPEDEGTRRHATEAFFQHASPPRAVIGVERPLYAHRRDGTNFRALMVAERFLAREGLMSVVTVREYLTEVDVLIRHLRRPYEVL